MIELGGLALALFGASVMLIAPLHRLTSHRATPQPHIGRELSKAFPVRPEDGANLDLLDKLR